MRDVSEITGFPEMLDGRVKTLHPMVHGGLLARRDVPEHMAAIAEHGITPIDLVVVNLYPFRETAARPGVTPEDVIEHIDIGGPSMLRSAAKNFASVWVIVDPADYGAVLAVLERDRIDDPDLRRRLAEKVYAHTAAYDAAIAAWFASQRERAVPRPVAARVRARAGAPLRREPAASAPRSMSSAGARACGALKQLGGKELSFNNLLDLEGALLAIEPFDDAAGLRDHQAHDAVRPRRRRDRARGVQEGARLRSRLGLRVGHRVHRRRWTTRRRKPSRACSWSASSRRRSASGAVEILGRKKNLRVLEGTRAVDARTRWTTSACAAACSCRSGCRSRTVTRIGRSCTQRQPTAAGARDLLFAWRAVASVKSNAIVLARDGATIGIGAGQMSRVDASFLAAHKARQQGHDTAGGGAGLRRLLPVSATASTRRPKPASTAIVQPGGSVRIAEVIAAADEHGIAMVFTGRGCSGTSPAQVHANSNWRYSPSASSRAPGGAQSVKLSDLRLDGRVLGDQPSHVEDHREVGVRSPMARSPARATPSLAVSSAPMSGCG